jgi:hypothetical protein
VTSPSEQAQRPGPTFLRVRAIRWLIAELVPFSCLAIGLAIAREWRPVAALGFVIAVLAGAPLTIFYLFKILGAAAAWIWPIILLVIGNTLIGGFIFVNSTVRDNRHPNGVKIAITETWWMIAAGLVVLLALTVAAAIANGERWIRRNRLNLPRNKFEAYARSRGTLAKLWLPR